MQSTRKRKATKTNVRLFERSTLALNLPAPANRPNTARRQASVVGRCAISYASTGLGFLAWPRLARSARSAYPCQSYCSIAQGPSVLTQSRRIAESQNRRFDAHAAAWTECNFEDSSIPAAFAGLTVRLQRCAVCSPCQLGMSRVGSRLCFAVKTAPTIDYLGLQPTSASHFPDRPFNDRLCWLLRGLIFSRPHCPTMRLP